MASIKELEKNKIEIEFEISQELLKQASLKAYNKNKGKINVPGFRKGMRPRLLSSSSMEKMCSLRIPLKLPSRMHIASCAG